MLNSSVIPGEASGGVVSPLAAIAAVPVPAPFTPALPVAKVGATDQDVPSQDSFVLTAVPGPFPAKQLQKFET